MPGADVPPMSLIPVDEAKARLTAAAGGYEVVHASPGLEVGVYVLLAPEPDRQSPHDDDEVYAVLEGSGVLTIERERTAVGPGEAVFVAAGKEHRFSDYERLVLLVVFTAAAGRATPLVRSSS